MFKKKKLRINAYLGYGTHTLFRATGRALEDEQVDFSANQNTFRTLKNIYKQLESDEIRKIEIELRLSDGRKYDSITDEEGYYQFEQEIPDLYTLVNRDDHVPYTVSYKKNKTSKKISQQNIFKSHMLIPSDQAEFAIISDIDDTILHTGVASFLKWRLLVNTLLKNYDKRIPIKGKVDFYKKLRLGTNKAAKNPFFYVSNSPWNLYDYLSAFLKKQDFPEGPILLRDFRTPFDKTPKPKLPHKQSEILHLLKIYPTLKFILVGDSGEKDADIYTKIANDNPNRILAIYLRNVKHKKREKRIRSIISSFSTVPILLVNTSEEAEAHAKALGFIK